VVKPSDKLSVRMYSRVQFDSEEHARKLVDYLSRHARFGPDVFGSHEPFRKLTFERVEQAISLIVNRASQQLDPERVFSITFFQRTRVPRCSYAVEWCRVPHRPFAKPLCSIEDGFVKKVEHLEEWLKFIFGMFPFYEPWYASVALTTESNEKNFLSWYTQHPRAKDPLKGVRMESAMGLELEKGIPGVYWGNYFSPFYIDWLGRAKFDELPCTEKRWLSTGGIFFTTAATPFDWNSVDSRQLQRQVLTYLGEDAFHDMETIRTLSARMEPLGERIKPEQLQSPRRTPLFPFVIEKSQREKTDEDIKETIRYFESKGFEFVSLEDQMLTFRDENGGITCVMAKPGGVVEYWPKLQG